MDAREFATAYGARALFDRTWRNVDELHRTESIIIAGVEGIEPNRHDTRRCKGETGDPTMSAALFRAEVAGCIYDRAVTRHAELADWVGEVLRLLTGIRAGLGAAYAQVLERRYIDGLEWREVAAEMGCTPRHARRLRGIACNWVDAVGWARACEGRGVAS